MNWFRTILDGLAMSAVFNCCVAVFWILKPHSFVVMFPKSLQKKARPVTKEEKCLRRNIMLYTQKEKRKQLLALGFIGMALFAVGDVLLQSFANKGEDILLMMKSSIRDMPMGRLYFTLLTGVIAAPFMYLGLSAMDSWLRDCLRERKGKMYSEN